MRLLITGATGFVGINLCKKLQELDVSFSCLTRVGSKVELLEENHMDYFVFDGKPESLIEYMQYGKFDGVVHLASLFVADHKKEDIEQLILSNVLLGTKLLDASVACSVKWFLNTGTFWQHYNGEKYNPVNLYAATKQAFEDIAKYYSEASGIKFVTLKLNDTYGPNDTRRKIFTLWDEVSKNGEELGMSPGKQCIDIVHIDKVIDAYIYLIYALQSNYLHCDEDSFYVTSGRKITLQELAKEYEDSNNVRLNIKWGAREYRKREVMNPKCIGVNVFEIMNNGKV